MDFSELTVLGWVGVLIRIVWILSMMIVPKIHFSYYSRFPKINSIDQYLPYENVQTIYMIIRAIVLFFFMWIITGYLL